MKTTEQLVRELADREAIHDLCARYCDCVWRKDLDGLVGLFVKDGSFAVEGLEVEALSRGHAKLKQVYQKAFTELDARLLLHNHVIELLDGERATGRCYVQVFTAKSSTKWVGLGYYEDEYARSGDLWKFASRHYFLDVIDTDVSLRKTFMV
jgi:hypothetical protein